MNIRDDQNSSSQSSESRPKKKPLILVVDDQTTVIRIMSNMLRPHFELCVANGGLTDLAHTKKEARLLIQ